jgi:CTD nuclear envelope phosphatase 1
MQEYADPVIDWLDAGRGIFEHRFFRDVCPPNPNQSKFLILSFSSHVLSCRTAHTQKISPL